MISRMLLISCLALALAGCAAQPRSENTRPTLTEHQRDSLIARSALPGAAVVGGALEQSTNEARHAAALDSLTR